ncbi:SDR family oxidoreductase [Phycicoccus sonneratiae]|uniref:SDR family oxidoreductase n=1 Tax=Phycicoccus sonneratiae TaxID=2807628 RepID=A0ABS2CKE6_9MICO|nr:SDR family oxidoreductase [Phycicoccus sonneraticus]MBM6400255.1 SDR family oxidoreductase [Phycicoccus sonneraticus]
MTTSTPRIAVTGATGAVGGMVARDLADRGVPQRLVVRDPSRAPQLPGAEVVAATYGDADAMRAALEGVDVLLLVSASESADRMAEHRSAVEAASAAGVGHVVYTSFLGAAADCTFTLGRDHWATEGLVRDAGLSHTFLRDSLYLDFLPLMVGEDGVVRGPAGDGRLGAVAREDVARTAVAALLDPDAHRNLTYDLTGPEALSFTEIAATIAEITGRPATFHDETVEEAYASRAGYGAPPWQLDAWVSTYTAVRAGELDVVTGDVERVTGRAPISLRELLART